MKTVKIDGRVSTGGQPTEADLATLSAQGVKTIVNLRRPGEQNQPLDPEAWGAAVKKAGLAYVSIPVDSKNLDPRQVDAVAAAIAASSGGCYVHCAGGGRATTHALLAEAKVAGHSADKVFARAQEVGAPITEEGFKAFVRTVAGSGR